MIIFLVKKPTFMWVKISEKKNIFSGLRSRYRRQANRKKLILPLKRTSKLRMTWPLALPVHNFLSHLHFSKWVRYVMLLKYENLMLLAGHILDLNCVQLSNAALFCENYTKLYFDVKHLEKGLNREWDCWCLFWQISNNALISRICPDRGNFQIKLPLILILKMN